jgi:hypothetical protein
MKRSELKQHCLRKLGHPVINIEIDDSQMELLIDEAMQMFTENHYDGVNTEVITLEVVNGVKNYTMPDNVQEVLEIINPRTLFVNDEPVLMRPHYAGSLSSDGGQINFSDMQTMRMMIKMVEESFTTKIMYDYNYTTKRLNLLVTPTVTTSYAVMAYTSEADLTKLYNNLWIKRMCASLFKKCWGGNISKYSGTLLNGMTINGDRIIAEADAEILKLEEELYQKYSLPPDPFFG